MAGLAGKHADFWRFAAFGATLAAMKKASPKQVLIDAALRAVASHGWTETALRHAAKDAGVPEGSFAAHFPGGVGDVIAAFHGQVTEAMQATLAATQGYAAMKVREKIFRAVMARMEALAPHKEAVRRLTAHQLLPWNAPARAGRCREGGGRDVESSGWTAAMIIIFTRSACCWQAFMPPR